MAKRKRLTPANPAIFGAAPETKSMPPARAPIADVAADASATAALDQISQELSRARAEGRMVLSLPLDKVEQNHLVRDRVAAQDPEMQALVQSIRNRGQQAPIEVMALENGCYGLISGWRRCQAVAQLTAQGAHDGQVLALLRQPSDASGAYLAMVEENEIRVGLSYFERARIAAKSVAQGVFETEKQALLTLFETASRPKRSKIRSFLPLVAAFDGVLRFPHLIGERLGLRMAAALSQDPAFATRITDALAAHTPTTPEAEQAAIEGVLKGTNKTGEKKQDSKAPQQMELGPNLRARWTDAGELTISGVGMTSVLRRQIIGFIQQAPKS